MTDGFKHKEGREPVAKSIERSNSSGEGSRNGNKSRRRSGNYIIIIILQRRAAAGQGKSTHQEMWKVKVKTATVFDCLQLKLSATV